jgi:hypothetical protein
MSDSNKYKLEDLQELPRQEIRKIANDLGINLNQQLKDLIKQILHPKSRKLTKAATKKFRTLKVETKPQTKKLSRRKKESSRSSRSGSSKRETPSPITEREKLLFNEQTVLGVISRIIINNDEYTFLSEIDFNYSEISKLLNIDYTNEWTKNYKTVKDYLESKNILKIAEDLYLIFKYVNELKKIINSQQLKEIENLCKFIKKIIIRININIKSQSNNIIKIKEEYKNTINTDIDKFNSKEMIKTNKFTITDKLI